MGKAIPFIFPYLLLTAALQAQEELTLFQETDTERLRESEARAPQPSNQNAEPAFTFKGASRFGDRYTVSLLARDGSTVRVQWREGGVVDIPGYNGYRVLDVDSRSVSISAPPEEGCVQAVEKGISCAGNIALLRLSNSEPLAARPAEPAAVAEGSLDEAGGGSGGLLATNPFSGEPQVARRLTAEELAEQEAQREERADRFRNFEIIRIADEDIPEGMERVRTPFGDTLQPLEQ